MPCGLLAHCPLQIGSQELGCFQIRRSTSVTVPGWQRKQVWHILGDRRLGSRYHHGYLTEVLPTVVPTKMVSTLREKTTPYPSTTSARKISLPPVVRWPLGCTGHPCCVLPARLLQY